MFKGLKKTSLSKIDGLLAYLKPTQVNSCWLNLS